MHGTELPVENCKMEGNLPPKKIEEGISNPCYEGSLNYFPLHSSPSPVPSEKDIKKKSPVKGSITSRRRIIRPPIGPTVNKVTSLLEKINIDTKKVTEVKSSDSQTPSSPPDSVTITRSPSRSPSADRTHPIVVESPHKRLPAVTWPKTYVKSRKNDPSPTPPTSPVQNKVKFTSKGLLSQSHSFTPLMYRRAISLRGPYNWGIVATIGNDPFAFQEISSSLKRCNSEKGYRQNHMSLLRKNVRSTSVSRSLSACSSSSKKRCMNRMHGCHEDTTVMQGVPRSRAHSREDAEFTIFEDDSSTGSCGSCESFDMAEFVKTNANCDRDFFYPTSDALANDLNFFQNDLSKYLNGLKSTLELYDEMKAQTEDKITEYFDLPIKELELMYKLQIEMNKDIELANGNLAAIAKVFIDDKFIVYKDFMIMCPNVLKDIQTHKDLLDTKCTAFKEYILKPSNRLNFYVQILSNFQRYATFAERNELRRAINHLEALKRDANTELTIKIIQECPIDLHLGGNILHVGELTYVSGPLPKRPYYLIAFENMLVVTISKVSYFVYVAHYRTEQLVSVGGEKELGLTLTATVCNQGASEVHKFKTSSNKVLETWYYLIEEWLYESTASYEIVPDTNLNDLNPSEGKLFPLSLWRVFPFLKKVLQSRKKMPLRISSQSPKPITSPIGNEQTKRKRLHDLAAELIEKETEYVVKLNAIFDPETLPPPPEIFGQLRAFLNLHELHFLPEMQMAIKRKGELVVDVFMNYLEKFSSYRNYMVKRALCTTQLPDGYRVTHYIVPVQQFSYYITWAQELGKHDAFSVASEFAVDTLVAFLTDAKVMLLHESIPNCCIDFYRTGELKRSEILELRVRPRQKGIRDGAYLVALFEKVMLITRPTPPRYTLVVDVWLNQINFGPPSEFPNAFKLEFRQGRNKLPITYELKSKSSLSKSGWVDDLAEELQKQADEIKKYSGSKVT